MADGQRFPRQGRTAGARIVKSISDRYVELFEHITGEKFVPQDTEDIAARIEQNVTNYLSK